MIRYRLAVIILLGMSSFNSTAHAGLSDGLVAHYPLNGSGADLSGNSLDGQVNGAVAITDRSGNPGGAMLFDGQNDYIIAPFSTLFDFDSQDFSVSVWIKTDFSGASGDDMRIVNYGGTVFNEFDIVFPDNGIVRPHLVRSDDIFFVDSDDPLNDDIWHHIVFVRDHTNTELRIYVDGVLNDTFTGGDGVMLDAGGSRRFTIGRKERTSGQANSYFEGAIDEVRVYDRSLTAAEILNLANDAVTLTVGMQLGTPGDTLCIPVTLKNAGVDSVGGMQFNVVHDDAQAATFLGLADTTLGNGFSVSSATAGDTVKIVLFSSSGAAIIPGDSLVTMTLKYRLEQAAQLGDDIALAVSGMEAGNTNGEVIGVDTANGALNIGIKGDVNLDGNTSILDVIKLVRIIIGKDPAPASGSTGFKIADMNGDGALNIIDVIALVNNILGIPSSKNVAVAPTQPVVVQLHAVPSTDGAAEIHLRLEGDGLVAGFQAVFTYDPSLITPGPVRFVDPIRGISVDGFAEQGIFRLVVFPLQPGAGVPLNTNPVVVIPISETAPLQETVFSMNEIMIAGPQAQIVPVFATNPAATITRSYGAPSAFSLNDAAPNPFNPSTTISYDLPEQALVSLTIYNLLGQEIVRLVNKVQAAGHYSVTWNARNAGGASVASGVYLFRLEAGDGFSRTRRMTLLK